MSIDYCPPADDVCARDTAARIRAAGVIPYVTGPALDVVGVGALAERVREPARAERRDGSRSAQGAQVPRDAQGWSGAHAAGPVQFVHVEADRAI